MAEYTPMPAPAVKAVIQNIYMDLIDNFPREDLKDLVKTFTKAQGPHVIEPDRGLFDHFCRSIEGILNTKVYWLKDGCHIPPEDLRKLSLWAGLSSKMPITDIKLSLSSAFLFSSCIKHVFSFECVVFDAAKNSYSLGAFSRHDDFLKDALYPLLGPRAPYLAAVDFSYNIGPLPFLPIYEMIFTKIKKLGLDWDYMNFDLLCMKVVEDDEAYQQARMLERDNYVSAGIENCSARSEEEEDFLGDKALEMYESTLITNRWGTTYPLSEHDDDLYHPFESGDVRLTPEEKWGTTFKAELRRLSKLKAPDSLKVIAYQHVYGKLPKGYPIDRSKYDSTNYLPMNNKWEQIQQEVYNLNK